MAAHDVRFAAELLSTVAVQPIPFARPGAVVQIAQTMKQLIALALSMLFSVGVFEANAQAPDAKTFKDAPFVPVPAGKPTPPPKYEFGSGGCEPVFPNGARGTCINNRPCNGFGFRDENGRLSCRCFAVPNGCAEGLVCSRRLRECVPMGSDGLQGTPSGTGSR